MQILLRLRTATTGTGQATQAIAKGTVGDFIAFDEDTGRFTDVVTEYFPSVINWLFDYLQSDEDDEWYEARFKNALEGAGLGALTEFTFRW